MLQWSLKMIWFCPYTELCGAVWFGSWIINLKIVCSVAVCPKNQWSTVFRICNLCSYFFFMILYNTDPPTSRINVGIIRSYKLLLHLRSGWVLAANYPTGRLNYLVLSVQTGSKQWTQSEASHLAVRSNTSSYINSWNITPEFICWLVSQQDHTGWRTGNGHFFFNFFVNLSGSDEQILMTTTGLICLVSLSEYNGK